ncbi:hypothetical protein SCHPADRAFT_942712 [Schizopora paradoxa]|uniref:Uncharacterized protein n=1 Tax=Schizopora paradoxa TaxID=27342 RepID=A0A0H2S0N1_9AGAM|nr:hypothetical protein SCHPADRAFT_942712 [Schizopora paradoxa]
MLFSPIALRLSLTSLKAESSDAPVPGSAGMAIDSDGGSASGSEEASDGVGYKTHTYAKMEDSDAEDEDNFGVPLNFSPVFQAKIDAIERAIGEAMVLAFREGATRGRPRRGDM